MKLLSKGFNSVLISAKRLFIICYYHHKVDKSFKL